MRKGDLEFYTSDDILDAIEEYLELNTKKNNNSWNLSQNKSFFIDLPDMTAKELSKKYNTTTTAIYYHKKKLTNSRSEYVGEINASCEKLGNRCGARDGESTGSYEDS